MSALIDKYSDEEFIEIVKKSKNMQEISLALGYSAKSGSNYQRIRLRIDSLGLNTDHFSLSNKRPIKRTVENIFIENSTADQATLRRYYKKGQYTDYICDICGQEPFWNGKELTLILDHKNGLNHDDRLENLHWVCPNCNQQLPTTGSKNPHRQNIAKKYYCKDCGKEISKKSTRCAICENKHRSTKEEDMLIQRDELKNLIRTTPFTQIGQQYGVSDNAIRKWCDKYNLPRKKSEINNYSEEEWLKI